MGDGLLIISFVVVVIGGLGSVSGAFWSALLIGLVDTLGKAYGPAFASRGGAGAVIAAAASMSVYILMVVVLLAGPTGLFGGAAVTGTHRMLPQSGAAGSRSASAPRCSPRCRLRDAVLCRPRHHGDDRCDAGARAASAGRRDRPRQPRPRRVLRPRRLCGLPALAGGRGAADLADPAGRDGRRRRSRRSRSARCRCARAASSS